MLGESRPCRQAKQESGLGCAAVQIKHVYALQEPDDWVKPTTRVRCMTVTTALKHEGNVASTMQGCREQINRDKCAAARSEL